MKNLIVLASALETVEHKLNEALSVEDLARSTYSSVSNLQKLFSYVFGCSVKEYITKRKLSKAAYELVHSDKTITEIALSYTYESPEVFSKAFKRFWGCLPSEYRKQHAFSELFPKFKVEQGSLGNPMENRRNVDVSELYEALKDLRGSIVLCTDIVDLRGINDNIGYGAGDLAIAESAKRIDKVIEKNMLMFRIGRDEFAIITKLTSLDEALILAKKITSFNTQDHIFEGKTFNLSLRIAINRIPEGPLSYMEILEKMFTTLHKIREDKTEIGISE
jgi:AraC family transcriptional regulator